MHIRFMNYERFIVCAFLLETKPELSKIEHIVHAVLPGTPQYTVEPRYKESDITKPSYNKVILLVPTLYISLFFYPDIMRNLI